ncbi:MAG: tail fiber protein [Bryobacteraceae bacterium]|jgi:microcystin-dependent protein
MADPFVGQLLLVGFNFPPNGWAFANGQILSIFQNTALFSLLGTMYGGDGKSNFGLPNLQGNVAIGFGQSPGLQYYTQGESGGVQNVTLIPSQTPVHNHTPYSATRPATQSTPGGNAFAESTAGNIYSTSTSPLTPMSAAAISPFGGNQPHNNMMPFVGLNWVIALQGIFPARS